MNSKSSKKYILGINKLTKSILKHVKVDGIIDDFTRVQRSRKKEIFNINDVPKDALILSTATGSPLEVKTKLTAMGFKHFDYLALYKYSNLELLAPPFMNDFKDDFEKNYERFSSVYSLLQDTKSKEIFTKLLNFKISFDYTFMQGFTNNHTQQYFEKELLPFIKNIKFVDCGAYVGDTAEQVIKNYPDYEKLYLFEPIEENLRIAKRELAPYKNIDFFACGVSNKKATLFIHEEKSFSTLYGNGTQSVEVDSLDNIITQRVDYIKFDIEGAEQDALLGATKTIKKYHPILAVCIYHKSQDWYKVPELILDIDKSYKIYVRHYMEGIFETVMYFI